MSPADRIAVRVKAQPLLKEASEIVVGITEFNAISNNPDPCNPPDFVDGVPQYFCGVPLRFDHSKLSYLAFVIRIP